MHMKAVMFLKKVSDQAVRYTADSREPLTLTREQYEDLGRPDLITVTIQSGDQLN